MKRQSIHAQVERVNPLTDSILGLILKPERYIDYKAGQYLDIHFANESASFSIANAPLGSHHYELHIRNSKENASNQRLLAEIKQRGALTLSIPFGDCHLDNLDEQKPILFIAGGTGFAPIKAMIEQLFASDDKRSFELFWGARSQSDLYMHDKLIQWQAHASHFRYFTLLPNTRLKDSLASMVLEQHQQDLNDWQIIISGPFDMVFATRDSLLAHGVSSRQMFSDAFSFEKKGE